MHLFTSLFIHSLLFNKCKGRLSIELAIKSWNRVISTRRYSQSKSRTHSLLTTWLSNNWISFLTSSLFLYPRPQSNQPVFWMEAGSLRTFQWHPSSLIIICQLLPMTWKTPCFHFFSDLIIHPPHFPLLKHSAPMALNGAVPFPQTQPGFALLSHSGLWASPQSWQAFLAHPVSCQLSHLHQSSYPQQPLFYP